MSPAIEAEFRELLIAQVSRHEKLVSDAISTILRTEIPAEVKVLMCETQSDWSTIQLWLSQWTIKLLTKRIMTNHFPDSC